MEVQALTAAYTKAAAALEELGQLLKSATTKPAAPAPAPAPAPAAPAEHTVSLDEVRKVLTAVITDNIDGQGKAHVQQTLQKHGAAKLSELDPAHYKAVLEEVNPWLIPF